VGVLLHAATESHSATAEFISSPSEENHTVSENGRAIHLPFTKHSPTVHLGCLASLSTCIDN
jgi:hypothetical protein